MSTKFNERVYTSNNPEDAATWSGTVISLFGDVIHVPKSKENPTQPEPQWPHTSALSRYQGKLNKDHPLSVHAPLRHLGERHDQLMDHALWQIDVALKNSDGKVLLIGEPEDLSSVTTRLKEEK
jgi:hypothetical protein